MQESGCNFQRVNSREISFHKTGEIKSSSYEKLLLRSSGILNIRNDVKYCFIWSIPAHLLPCELISNRISEYRQNFDELNFEGFAFKHGYSCTDLHKFEKMNNSSEVIFELIFYPEQNIWKHKQIPIGISKNVSDRIVVFFNLQKSISSH